MLDCEKYNCGEEALKKYLTGCGFEIVDTTKDPQKRELYDFEAYKDGMFIGSFEAKYSNYLYRGEVPFETIQIRHTKGGEVEKEGWGSKCQADYITFYDPKTGDLYRLKFRELKRYAQTKELPTKKTNKDGYKTTYFRVISLRDYKQDGNEVKVINVGLF